MHANFINYNKNLIENNELTGSESGANEIRFGQPTEVTAVKI